MEIDIVVQQIMEFLEWEIGNRYTPLLLGANFWRRSSLPHLSNIGKVPMDGGAEHRLNIGAFLCFLQLEHFRNVQVQENKGVVSE